MCRLDLVGGNEIQLPGIEVGLSCRQLFGRTAWKARFFHVAVVVGHRHIVFSLGGNQLGLKVGVDAAIFLAPLGQWNHVEILVAELHQIMRDFPFQPLVGTGIEVDMKELRAAVAVLNSQLLLPGVFRHLLFRLSQEAGSEDDGGQQEYEPSQSQNALSSVVQFQFSISFRGLMASVDAGGSSRFISQAFAKL